MSPHDAGPLSDELRPPGLLPTLVAREVKDAVASFLDTTFGFSDPGLAHALRELVTGSHGGLFRGPYISLLRPYARPLDGAAALARAPLEVKPPFVPYEHQLEAFERLSTLDGRSPSHTLVTTGTGSGKTECFLYPILDHALRSGGARGVKALVLYPMNALATDQAERFARTIREDERLAGKVRVGLYVGDDVGGRHGAAAPAVEGLVTDRNRLRDDPPDILLTNYRMLDYLLLRPDDAKLWRFNGPGTLRYLVLDELHTYDGAQGGDVALLLRRLRARLEAGPGDITCVGTSATVAPGGEPGAGARASLCGFAEQIFGVPFDEGAVIGERRMSHTELTEGDSPDADRDFPIDVDALRPREREGFRAYLQRQMRLWLDEDGLDAVALGERLRVHPLFGALLVHMQRPRTDEELSRALVFVDAWERVPESARPDALRSFLDLVATARRQVGGREEPLVHLQVHLWMRELRRLVRVVQDGAPELRWDSDPSESDLRALPVWFCRECGTSGWLTTQRKGDAHFSDKLAEIYDEWFQGSELVRYLVPGHGDDDPTLFPLRLDPRALTPISAEEIDGVRTVAVRVHHPLSQGKRRRDTRRCPSCDNLGALHIAGAQSATLGSVAVSQLFSTTHSADRKLLAFTDSVQEATHRAGFFTGRAFRFQIRSAFYEALRDVPRLPLSELGERTLFVLDERHGQKEATARVLPPDVEREPEVRSYFRSPRAERPPALDRHLRERIGFEAVLEMGFSSRVGRTLLKSVTATRSFDRAALEGAVDGLARLLPEEGPSVFGDVEPRAAIERLTLGLLHRLAERGGIAHPWLATYAQRGGDTFHLYKERNRWIAPLPLSQRRPRFLTQQRGHRTFDEWRVEPSGHNYVWDWLAKALGTRSPSWVASPEHRDDANRVAAAIASTLTSFGLLVDLGKEPGHILGIPAEKVFVSTSVSELSCDRCHHRLALVPDEAAAFAGGPCTQHTCKGTLREGGQERHAYYRRMYTSGELHRVFGREHTGLLSRAEREDAESRFKRKQSPVDPNLLACTPTLEMGVDIGDLSATLLCRVPPSVASFVQRVGRAGRSTGNSLLLTQVGTEPHDLYFFAEPLEMVAGEVVTPGTFLDAPEMLARQLFAYCLTRWTRSTPKARIPGTVNALLADEKAGRFPQPLLDFVKERRDELHAGFCALLGGAISEESRRHLLDALDGLEASLEAHLAATRARVDELERVRRRLSDRLKALADEAALLEEQRREQEREIKADRFGVEAEKRALHQMYTLSYLVDHGFLPNYAFSEPGVTLRALIWDVPSGDALDDGATGFEEHEWRRAAGRAIKELAPGNTFYASGRKVRVDRVVLSGERESAVLDWVFCADCSFAAPAARVKDKTTCPGCGAASFGEAGQVLPLAELREVAARESHLSSMVLDKEDERDQQPYYLRRLFRVDPSWGTRAFADESRAFGYEWVGRMELLEVNFGRLQRSDTRVRTEGEEQVAPGFLVCQSCGAVVDDAGVEPRGRTRHLSRCKRKNDPTAYQPLHLYRKTASEALRVLVPVTAFDTEARMANLRAVLHLGLRLHFRGSPQHLLVDEMSEPADGGGRRRFLVLYDAVPGGTGYLKDLARSPERFLDLLRLAQRRLEACSCQRGDSAPPVDDEGGAAHDGCYRCLFTREVRRDIGRLSKRKALELLGELLPRVSLERRDTLSDIAVAQLADSELEKQFLARFLEAAHRAGFSSSQVAGGGYLVHRLKRGHERLELKPQVDIDSAHGVEVRCRPDFLLKRVRDADGKLVRDLPIAVFCDGFTVHAHRSDGTSLLADDIKKRAALLRSGRFRVWSVTWDDLVTDKSSKVPLPLVPADVPLRRFDDAAGKLGLRTQDFLEKSNVECLLELATKGDSAFAACALAFATCTLRSPPIVGDDDSWEAHREAQREHGAQTVPVAGMGGAPHGALRFFGVALDALLDPVALKGASPADPGAAVRWRAFLEDEPAQREMEGFKPSWRRFLAYANLMQGAPDGELRSRESVAAEVLGRTVNAAALSASAAGWELEADAAVLARLAPLIAAGVPAPEALLDIGDDDGEIFGTAEVAWEEARVALLHPDLATDFDVDGARGAGWQVLVLDDGFDAAYVERRVRGEE